MAQYDKVIKDTIKKNNEDIYKKLYTFLSADPAFAEDSAAQVGLKVMGVGGQGMHNFDEKMSSQVPTCLVITSNESSSSIDT